MQEPLIVQRPVVEKPAVASCRSRSERDKAVVESSNKAESTNVKNARRVQEELVPTPMLLRSRLGPIGAVWLLLCTLRNRLQSVVQQGLCLA